MIYQKMKSELRKICAEHGWLNKSIPVKVRPLSEEESLGRPSQGEYPILKGKERMVEATFLGARGQAFTDMPGDFSGALEEVISLALVDNFERAVFFATLNAVLRQAGLIEGTVHCKDDEPVECGREMADYIESEYGRPKIFQVGLQPRIAEELSRKFELRITDLDRDKIGKKVGNAVVESVEMEEENLAWCDVVVATGSTFVNDSAQRFLSCGKPVIFYGNSCAGAAHILGLRRFCAKSR